MKQYTVVDRFGETMTATPVEADSPDGALLAASKVRMICFSSALVFEGLPLPTSVPKPWHAQLRESLEKKR